jgi:HD domain-containing protein
MCLALGTGGLDRRTLLGRIARLGGSAAALTALGPVVWAQSGKDPPLPAEVAGVKLPLSKLVRKAAREVFAEAPPVIYFHSVRTFVLASLYADSRTPKLTFKRELVMLASLFHDIGLTVKGEQPKRPFEVVSAERAREFVVREGGFSAGDADLVYRGIALHFGQAQNQLEAEVRLIEIGTSIDLFSKILDKDDFPTQPVIDRIAKALPRHRFKTAFLEEQRAHVARTGDPGPVAEWVVDPEASAHIAASRWPE